MALSLRLIQYQWVTVTRFCGFEILLLFLALGEAAAQSFTVSMLSPPAGMVLVQVCGINSAGQILGLYQEAASSSFHSMLRSADGGTYALIAVPGASQTFGAGLNNLGQVTGYYIHFAISSIWGTASRGCLNRTPLLTA